MADVQVWDSKVHLLGGEVVYAHHYVYADPSQVNDDLRHAFKYQAVVRVGGVQLWDSGKVPLQNGPITAKPDPAVQAFNLGTLDAEIDDFDGLDSQGHSTGANWSNAAALSFLVSAKAAITLPTATIATALAALGPAGVAARALLLGASLFAKKVHITLGHSNVTIPLQRDASRKLVQVNHVPMAVGAPA